MPDDDADDHELLREFCATRAEGAFRALVERHLPAVWSAARRMVNGDGALAEDVAQEVFAHLAVHAPKLPPRVVLAGWLHRHTCFTAAKAVRTAVRRRERELQHAYDMTATATPGNSSDMWPEVSSHLDAAINSLPATDRDAVVLRFFEKRDFRSIAVMLGTSEDAARMKTARAVEKLRGMLGKKSALLTVALLTSLLADKSVAAPAGGLAGRIAESALARAAGAAAVPAAGGVAGMWRRLRPLRAAVIGGALLLLSGFAVWQWTSGMHAEEKPRGGVAAGLNNKNDAGDESAWRTLDVTVSYFLVPEARAAELLANRWNADEDSALLKSLSGQAGSGASGVRLVQKRTAPCLSGETTKLDEGYQVDTPNEFQLTNQGEVEVTDVSTWTVGEVTELYAELTEGGAWCDVNYSVQYDYAKPGTHRLVASLEDPENKALPGLDYPEFRKSRVVGKIMVPPGESALVQSSQLPRLPDTPEQRLFVFLTVTKIEP